MSNDRVTFTKTATTKAKKPRTWEITYTLIDGPAIKPKKANKASAESEPASTQTEEAPDRKSRSKRKKTESDQESLNFDR